MKNTGITAFVAFKQIVTFPDDPVRGGLFPVDHPLTYSKLASYGFDPNAEVLLALEIIASRAVRGETVLMEAFGGGFTWGSVLLKY